MNAYGSRRTVYFTDFFWFPKTRGNRRPRNSARHAVAVLIASLLIGSCIGCTDEKTVNAALPSEIETVRTQDDLTRLLAESEQRVVMLEFYADWCAPCRDLAPTMERLARDLRGRLTVAKINVDDHPALAKRYRVRGIPTVVFVKDRNAVGSLLGVHPRKRYQEALQNIN